MIGQAFDNAWAEVQINVNEKPDSIEATRLSLANIVLSLAKDDSGDPEEDLKNEAVRVFRLKQPFAI